MQSLTILLFCTAVIVFVPPSKCSPSPTCMHFQSREINKECSWSAMTLAFQPVHLFCRSCRVCWILSSKSVLYLQVPSRSLQKWLSFSSTAFIRSVKFNGRLACCSAHLLYSFTKLLPGCADHALSLSGLPLYCSLSFGSKLSHTWQVVIFWPQY